MTEPPRWRSDAALFRSLLKVPRPTAPLRYRLRGAEDVALGVRAIRSVDEAEVAELAATTDPRALHAAAAELVTRAVITEGDASPAFTTAAELDFLTDEELLLLAQSVRVMLSEISPTFVRSDWRRWIARLKAGAKHPSNVNETCALGGCVDMVVGATSVRMIDRPDRYFGLPLCEMVDAHWMVFRAACDALKELSKKK